LAERRSGSGEVIPAAGDPTGSSEAFSVGTHAAAGAYEIHHDDRVSSADSAEGSVFPTSGVPLRIHTEEDFIRSLEAVGIKRPDLAGGKREKPTRRAFTELLTRAELPEPGELYDSFPMYMVLDDDPTRTETNFHIVDGKELKGLLRGFVEGYHAAQHQREAGNEEEALRIEAETRRAMDVALPPLRTVSLPKSPPLGKLMPSILPGRAPHIIPLDKLAQLKSDDRERYDKMVKDEVIAVSGVDIIAVVPLDVAVEAYEYGKKPQDTSTDAPQGAEVAADNEDTSREEVVAELSQTLAEMEEDQRNPNLTMLRDSIRLGVTMRYKRRLELEQEMIELHAARKLSKFQTYSLDHPGSVITDNGGIVVYKPARRKIKPSKFSQDGTPIDEYRTIKGYLPEPGQNDILEPDTPTHATDFKTAQEFAFSYRPTSYDEQTVIVALEVPISEAELVTIKPGGGRGKRIWVKSNFENFTQLAEVPLV
jgi:hypothetical protein